MRSQVAPLAASEPEEDFAAEIPAPRLLIRLHRPMRSRMRSRSASAKAAAIVRNSFDRPLPEMSPAQIEQVELDALALQALDDLKRLEGRAEQELRGCGGERLSF
jgi:hypothetical protein